MTNKEKTSDTSTKKTKSSYKRKAKKLSISTPYDFRHVDHVGFESRDLSKTGIVANEVRKFKEVTSQPQASETSPNPIAPVRRSRRLKKLDISNPYDFRHVDHVGFESSDVVKASPVAEEISKLEEIASHQKKNTSQNSCGTSAHKHLPQRSSGNVASERSKSSDPNPGRSSRNNSFKRSVSAQSEQKDVKQLVKQASCEEKLQSVKATSVLFSKDESALSTDHSVTIPNTSKQMETSSNQKNEKPTIQTVNRQVSTDSTGDNNGRVRKLQDIFLQRADSEKVKNSSQKVPHSPLANEQQPQPHTAQLEASKGHIVSGPSSSTYKSHTLPGSTEDEKLPPWMAELGKKERTRLIATVLQAERAKVKDGSNIGAATNTNTTNVPQKLPKRQAPPPPSIATVDKLESNPRKDQGEISSTTIVKNNEHVKPLNEKIDSTNASPPVPKPRRKKQQQQQGYIENMGVPTPLLGTPEMIKKRLLIPDSRTSALASNPEKSKPIEKEKKKEIVEQPAEPIENNKCSEDNTDSDDDDATIRL